MYIENNNQTKHTPNWKTLLAIFSFTLSIFIWFSGLIGSLQRPSVANSLELRRLELVSLGMPSESRNIVQFFVGKQPEDSLQNALEKSHISRKRDILLNISLQEKIQRSANSNFVSTWRVKSIYKKYWTFQTPEYSATNTQEKLLKKIYDDPLLFKLNCEILKYGNCRQLIPESKAFLQILGVTIPPILALIIGGILLLRQIWLIWRRENQSLPILIAPALGLIDIVLLISGGFVTLGETASSILVIPLTQATTNFFHLASPLREAISIVLLYLGLSVMPLVILILTLRPNQPAPPEGFLQLHWKPLGSTISQATISVLSVCPLVVALEQLSKIIINTPSGSNPLMTLLLNNHNPLALMFFSFPAVILAPLFEELIFRGVLLPSLGRKLGPGWGVILSSLIFSIAHLSLGELAPLTALGLGLGWLRVTSGRLAPCVLMHAFWNSFTVINLLLLGS
uniref:Putative membrane associated protease n=1 Tax=Paulinella micropora TaxID=1928728 RepID=A0A385I1K1_9EUKA|nr:putative membrane associated protease [Paulinella micropora]AXY63791.1 putative membrane associated protease [Paulinella micropora]